MRMKELEQATGIPRTTIHFYFREGMLPAPEKSAVNAAVYTDEHVQRLLLIKRLKDGTEGPMPMYLIRRILELVDQGVAPDVAIALERAVLAENAVPDSAGPFTIEELSKMSGVPLSELRRYVEYGLLLITPGQEDAPFDQLDAAMAREFYEVMTQMGWTAEDFAPISKKIREISDYEWELRNRAVYGKKIEISVKMRARMQQFANFMHRYLFYRARLHNIESELISKQAPNS